MSTTTTTTTPSVVVQSVPPQPTMRAARYYGKEDIRIDHDVPEPSPTHGQVKIRPAFVGICGTDLHEYLGGPNFCPVAGCPHPITGDVVPVTLGHEFSGVITELGPGVTGLEVGQPCAVQPTLACGACPACAAGADNVCTSGGFVGLSGGGGGLSDAVCVAADRVFPLPRGLPLEMGALVEPLAVAWHAIGAAAVAPDSVVVILGGGPIGLAAILCLRAKGVRNIIVSEVAASRQDFAARFGASTVVNPIKENLKSVSLELSGGRGADVVFDCAGVPASIKGACDVVRARGTVVNVAIWEKEIPFNPNWLTFKESTFRSVLGYQRQDFQAVIDHLASGAIDPRQMITGKIKMENIVDDGIKALIHDKDNQVKILVDISAR